VCTSYPLSPKIQYSFPNQALHRNAICMPDLSPIIPVSSIARITRPMVITADVSNRSTHGWAREMSPNLNKLCNGLFITSASFSCFHTDTGSSLTFPIQTLTLSCFNHNFKHQLDGLSAALTLRDSTGSSQLIAFQLYRSVIRSRVPRIANSLRENKLQLIWQKIWMFHAECLQ
jgi:hypothetical protein